MFRVRNQSKLPCFWKPYLLWYKLISFFVLDAKIRISWALSSLINHFIHFLCRQNSKYFLDCGVYTSQRVNMQCSFFSRLRYKIGIRDKTGLVTLSDPRKTRIYIFWGLVLPWIRMWCFTSFFHKPELDPTKLHWSGSETLRALRNYPLPTHIYANAESLQAQRVERRVFFSSL